MKHTACWCVAAKTVWGESNITRIYRSTITIKSCLISDNHVNSFWHHVKLETTRRFSYHFPAAASGTGAHQQTKWFAITQGKGKISIFQPSEMNMYKVLWRWLVAWLVRLSFTKRKPLCSTYLCYSLWKEMDVLSLLCTALQIISSGTLFIPLLFPFPFPSYKNTLENTGDADD